MNRIILIGNGFDLAHGLPTSYKNFIEDYWKTRIKSLYSCDSKSDDDGLSQFYLHIPTHLHSIRYPLTIQNFLQYHQCNDMSLEKIKKVNADSQDGNMKYSYTNQFLGIVDKAFETKTWVDIENEYYRQLTGISQKGNKIYKEPQQLDSEFEAIKTKLISYLTKIQDERICSGLKNTCIEKAIYEPFDIRDISNQGMKNIHDFLRHKIDQEDSNIENIQKNYDYHFLIDKLEIVNYRNSIIDISDPTSDNIETPYNLEKHLANIKNKSKSVPDYFLLPDEYGGFIHSERFGVPNQPYSRRVGERQESYHLRLRG